MTMPYSRTQLVLSKYCLTLFGMAVGCALYFIISLVVGFMGWGHVFSWEQTIFLLGILVFGILFYSGLTYPLIFKFGVEKGRIWFFATTILVSAGAGFLYSSLSKMGIAAGFFTGMVFGACRHSFIASAFLSVHFYKGESFDVWNPWDPAELRLHRVPFSSLLLDMLCSGHSLPSAGRRSCKLAIVYHRDRLLSRPALRRVFSVKRNPFCVLG